MSVTDIQCKMTHKDNTQEQWAKLKENLITRVLNQPGLI